MNTPKPETFAGTKQEDINQWLIKFIRIAKANEWKEEKYVQHCAVYLHGYASEWLNALETGEKLPTTWVEFEKKLKAEFLPSDFELQNLHKIDALKVTTEGVKPYAIKFKSLLQNIKSLSEELKIERFLKGLPYNFIEKVYCQNPATLESAIEMATTYEVVVANAERIAGGPEAKRQFEMLNIETGTPIRKKMTEAERARCMSEGRCFWCREKGHSIKECPTKPKFANESGKAQGQ
jgi:hypothetical protein